MNPPMITLDVLGTTLIIELPSVERHLDVEESLLLITRLLRLGYEHYRQSSLGVGWEPAVIKSEIDIALARLREITTVRTVGQLVADVKALIAGAA